MWICLPLLTVLIGGPSERGALLALPTAKTYPSAEHVAERQSQKRKQNGWNGLVSLFIHVLSSRKAQMPQQWCLSHKVSVCFTYRVTHTSLSHQWFLPTKSAGRKVLHRVCLGSSAERSSTRSKFGCLYMPHSGFPHQPVFTSSQYTSVTLYWMAREHGGVSHPIGSNSSVIRK